MEQLTQRERITQYAQDRFNAEPEHLWARFPNSAVFRHPASRKWKWFVLIMDIPRNRLGLKGDEPVDRARAGSQWVAKCS